MGHTEVEDMRKALVVSIALLSGLCVNAGAQSINLSMKGAVKLAVEKNLELRTELYNSAMANAEVRRNRGIYNTVLGMNVDYTDSRTFPAVLGATGNQKTLRADPKITQFLPTGGNLEIHYNNSRIITDYAFSTFPDYWTSELSLGLTQPLLRNFGPKVANLNIVLAEKARDATVKRIAAKIQALVAQVRVEYFKLNSLREDLQAKKVALDLANRILNDVSEKVKAGALPSMEVLNAEYGVSSREKEQIDAEKAVKDQVDLLRRLLQLPSEVDINAVEAPNLARVSPNLPQAITMALSQRPEIEEAHIQIASAQAQFAAARNKILPSLNLFGSFALTGTAPSYAGDMERLTSRDFKVWNVGMQLEYPLGNDAAEGEYQKSRYRLDQSRNQLADIESAVITEIRTAARSVDANFKQLDVAARGKTFAEERLKAYLSKAEVGLATTKDVLDVQNDLATAQNNQIRAQVAYVAAVTQFLQASGQLLDQEGITVNGQTIGALLPGR